jgi:condensin complex subunit 2
LDVWLKAIAENKITPKNTWNAPTIDHFSNVEEIKGINFQKASTTLDGCTKVYSTRVDTVIDDTLNTNDESRQKKKGLSILENVFSNLNLREEFFSDPAFSKYKLEI